MPVRYYRGLAGYDLAGVMAMKSYGGWLDDVGSFITDIVPSQTIVGRALRGDVSGATAGALRLVTPQSRPTQATPTPIPTAVPQSGFSFALPSIGGLPPWVLPAALGVLVLALVMVKTKK